MVGIYIEKNQCIKTLWNDLGLPSVVYNIKYYPPLISILKKYKGYSAQKPLCVKVPLKVNPELPDPILLPPFIDTVDDCRWNDIRR